MVIEHDYGDKCVKLDIHVVSNFSGEARGAEGQLSEWVAISELSHNDFPAANADIIEKIQLEDMDDVEDSIEPKSAPQIKLLID